MIGTLILTLVLTVPVFQDAEATTPSTSAEVAQRAQSLKARIHDMRVDVLSGGELVRRAEADAKAFYASRVEAIDKQLDALHADHLEERASYDLALDRALNGPNALARKAGMADATKLKERVDFLEAEQQKLGNARTAWLAQIETIKARERERAAIAAHLEPFGTPDDGMGFPGGRVGLGPEDAGQGLVLSDGLMDDLLERDPLRARRLLYETDPEGYWQRFGLQPPADVLLLALPFPAPDLPGRR